MSGVAYHAWTHRPKEQGGTDPIPSAPANPIEWVYYESTTNWVDTGLVTLSFTFQGGNYNTDIPTFDLVGGNPQICRPGHYETQVAVFNYDSVAGVQTAIRADFERVSGATPSSWRSPAGALPQLSGGDWSSETLTTWPFTVDFWDYPGDGSVPFVTPTTWKVDAQRLDDSLITADVDVKVRVAMRRLGDAF